jgi:hypothetical protein
VKKLVVLATGRVHRAVATDEQIIERCIDKRDMMAGYEEKLV